MGISDIISFDKYTEPEGITRRCGDECESKRLSKILFSLREKKTAVISIFT